MCYLWNFLFSTRHLNVFQHRLVCAKASWLAPSVSVIKPSKFELSSPMAFSALKSWTLVGFSKFKREGRQWNPFQPFTQIYRMWNQEMVSSATSFFWWIETFVSRTSLRLCVWWERKDVIVQVCVCVGGSTSPGLVYREINCMWRVFWSVSVSGCLLYCELCKTVWMCLCSPVTSHWPH